VLFKQINFNSKYNLKASFLIFWSKLHVCTKPKSSMYCTKFKSMYTRQNYWCMKRKFYVQHKIFYIQHKIFYIHHILYTKQIMYKTKQFSIYMPECVRVWLQLSQCSYTVAEINTLIQDISPTPQPLHLYTHRSKLTLTLSATTSHIKSKFVITFLIF